MPNLYYHKISLELKEINQETIDAWKAAQNPKADDYILAPEKPSENAVWSNGMWNELPHIPVEDGSPV